MKSVKLLLTTVCVASLSFLAYAGEGEKKADPTITTDAEKMEFQRLDANQDGAINEEEAQQGGLEQFAKADQDSDGKLTLAEYVAIVRNDVSSR